jgi:homoserine kinase
LYDFFYKKLDIKNYLFLIVKKMNYLKIFAPATVANVSCGFDAMGFAVDKMGDEMTFTKTKEKGVKITQITGAEGLTLDPTKNAAGVVALAMLKEYPVDFGIEMTMHKGFSPGSGLGSSAASSGGAAFGVNQLLGNPFSLLQLTQFAMLGEGLLVGHQFLVIFLPLFFGVLF